MTGNFFKRKQPGQGTVSRVRRNSARLWPPLESHALDKGQKCCPPVPQSDVRREGGRAGGGGDAGIPARALLFCLDKAGTGGG